MSSSSSSSGSLSRRSRSSRRSRGRCLTVRIIIRSNIGSGNDITRACQIIWRVGRCRSRPLMSQTIDGEHAAAI